MGTRELRARSTTTRCACSLHLLALAMMPSGFVSAANIQANSYAWSENAGWLNFAPNSGPGVTVSDTAVTGFAWSENLGWINFAPMGSGGVANDGTGKLYGYAWGENAGWIHFSPNATPVVINAGGQFTGYAWGENIGWINFNVTPGVTSSWRGSDVIFANGFEVLPSAAFAITYE